MPSRKKMKQFCEHGLTLIELLVVVAVFAILIAIVVPSVGSARNRSRAVQCVGNARTVAQTLFVYATDYQDRFPHYAKPAVGTVLWASSTTPLQFLDATIWYTIPLKAYFGDVRVHPSWFCPKDPDADVYLNSPNDKWEEYLALPGSYALAAGVYTIPKLWQPPGGDPTDDSYYLVQSWSSIAAPSRKGILYEEDPWHEGFTPASGVGTPNIPSYKQGKHHSLVLGDLSSTSKRFTDLLPGFKLPGPHHAIPVATTKDGILGYDLP
jgi:prepilin-type N-terminal cleavage/methylation domain-containing protein